MNCYKFSDIYIGLQESFKKQITEEMLESFRKITGDDNPLHSNTAFAEKMGYHTTVVFGMLSASFLSTLAGVYLPGENSLIYSTEIKFIKPVFPGDTLEISGKVKELNQDFKIFTMKVWMINQNCEKVLRGEMKVGFLNEAIG